MPHHERRAQIRRRRVTALAVLVATVAALGFAVAGTGDSSAPGTAVSNGERPRAAQPPAAPAPAQLTRAAEFARARQGNVSFAVVDTDVRLRGVDARRQFASASVVKAMILVAYLELAEDRGALLTRSERASLSEMIRRSDNASATRLANTVGSSRLQAVARRAGMRNTLPQASAWGLTQTTAEDQARFFARIDDLAPARHRPYARQLLATIIPEHRWGIPRAAPRDGAVLFKGGWLPDEEGAWRVHQIAKVERGGRQVAVAVMTDDNPSRAYGESTVEGVATRLLR